MPAMPRRVAAQQATLRLADEDTLAVDQAAAAPPRIRDYSDARWVLAVRVSEQLEGSILPPNKREQLVRLGKVLGLTAFDANLVIAIVQDQARRGYPADHCAAASEPQLRMITPAQPRGWFGRLAHSRMALIVGLIGGFVLLETLLIKLLF